MRKRQEKEERKKEVEELWNSKNFDLISFEKALSLNQKWLNKTAKRHQTINEMDLLIEKIYKELKTIERFAEDFETVKSVYLDCLDLSDAVEYGERLAENRKRVQKEAEERAEREATEKALELQKELNRERFEKHNEEFISDIVSEALGFEEEKPKQEPVKEFVLSFLKVIFFYAIPQHRHPMDEISLRQKNSRIPHFLHCFTFSLRYFASLRLCVEINRRF